MAKPKLNQFDNSTQEVIRHLIQNIQAHDAEVSDLEDKLIAITGDSYNIYTRGEIQQFVKDEGPKIALDNQTASVIDSLNMMITKSIENATDIDGDRYDFLPEKLLYVRQLLRETINDQTGAFLVAQDISDPKDRNLIHLVATGEAEIFLKGFFSITEPHNDLPPVDVLNVLVQAIIQDKNLPLQEFYGKNAPKAMRGKLKPGFNHTFKDTDTLKEFLYQHYLLTGKDGQNA